MNLKDKKLLMGDTRGKRIFNLRKLLKLSRRAFAEKYGISAANLQNWETDRYKNLNQEMVEALINAFRQEKIEFTVEWLLYGTGVPPIFRNSSLKSIAVYEDAMNHDYVQRTKMNAEQIELNRQLYEAVKEGRHEAVKNCIAAGANPYFEEDLPFHLFADTEQNTPLHIASSKGYLEIVKILAEKGARIDQRNKKRQTPLHVAVSRAHKAIVNYLLQQGADLNSTDMEGDTPLACAALRGQTEIFKILLEMGASPLSKNNRENTPLHLAASKGWVDIIGILVNLQNVDLRQKNGAGLTALECAVNSGQSEAVVFLLKSLT